MKLLLVLKYTNYFTDVTTPRTAGKHLKCVCCHVCPLPVVVYDTQPTNDICSSPIPNEAAAALNVGRCFKSICRDLSENRSVDVGVEPQ